MTDTKSSPQKNIDQTDVVLRVENLVKHYPIKSGVFGRANATVHAVEGVSFELHRGETLGIVGESGCGKSTAGKCILRLTDPTSGEVMLDGKDFTKLSGTALKDARQKMKLIFQDPYSSLNPRMTVMDIIGEPIDIAKTYATRSERDARIEEVMQEVGLDLAFKYRYPHEFSGGQRQRIALPEPLYWSLKSSYVTSRFQRWMFPCKQKLSTCLSSSNTNMVCHIFLSAMIFPLCAILPIRFW